MLPVASSSLPTRRGAFDNTRREIARIEGWLLDACVLRNILVCGTRQLGSSGTGSGSRERGVEGKSSGGW